MTRLKSSQRSINPAAPRPGYRQVALRRDGVYAAMAQKERELISERTRAALAAAKARGAVLGGDRGYRPSAGPCAAAAATTRTDAATRIAHRLSLEIDGLRGEGVTTLVGLARCLTERGVPTPRGGAVWTHTTVARVLGRILPEQDIRSVSNTRRASRRTWC